MVPDEYVLTLKTGERIEVSEFAYERSPELASVKALRPYADVVRGCAVLTRESVEAAKMGYDVELRKVVREPVAGLLKVARPECVHLSSCAMADRQVCTAKNVKGSKRIPPCWEHAEGELQGFATAVVLAWAAGRRVILVVPDPRALQEALSSGAPRAG